jgi:fatty acid amide hydrolase 2
MNVLRAPATVAPMGRDAAGLPLSIQIAAARGQDRLTIAAALALEQDFGGWIRPAAHARSR